MKMLILAGLAVLATPALAQMTPAPATPPAEPQTMPAPAPAPPAPDAMTPPPPPPAPDAAMAPPPPPPPPAPDATMAPSAPPPAAQSTYPACSRTVTDQCIERATPRRRR